MSTIAAAHTTARDAPGDFLQTTCEQGAQIRTVFRAKRRWVEMEERAIQPHHALLGTSPLARASLTRPASRPASARATASPNVRDPVVPPPLVILLGGGPLMDLFDQILIEHPLNRPIEGACAQANVAIGARGNVLDDGIPVEVAFSQGHEDVKRCRLQWKQGFGAWLIVRSPLNYMHCGYIVNA